MVIFGVSYRMHNFNPKSRPYFALKSRILTSTGDRTIYIKSTRNQPVGRGWEGLRGVEGAGGWPGGVGGGALGYLLGGYVPPRTPNWHPVLEKISPKTDTPF